MEQTRTLESNLSAPRPLAAMAKIQGHKAELADVFTSPKFELNDADRSPLPEIKPVYTPEGEIPASRLAELDDLDTLSQVHSEAEAQYILKKHPKSLRLPRFHLDQTSAPRFKDYEGQLFLDGETSLRPEVALIMGTFKASLISLNGLKNPDVEVLQAFRDFPNALALGIETLPDEWTAVLGTYVCALQLDCVTDPTALTPENAKSFKNYAGAWITFAGIAKKDVPLRVKEARGIEVLHLAFQEDFSR